MPSRSDAIKLCQTNLPQFLHSKIQIPTYDRSKITSSIVHIGVGGFHRSHQALYAERLIVEHGITNCGICGVGLMAHDAHMNSVMQQQDCLYTLMTKQLDGSVETRVIGSIVEFMFAPENPDRVIAKMSSPEVKIISMTITEGGYHHRESTDDFDSDNQLVAEDLAGWSHNRPPKTVFGYLARALRTRLERSNGGLAIMSCDNIQGNGDLTKRMLLSFIRLMNDQDLLDWVNENVSFPNSMVDRITPATVDLDRHNLQANFGINDEWPVVCESFIQWVIENDFKKVSRPSWELVGAKLVDDVVPYENMKLMLLNAGHSVLGILGALHGYDTIDQAAEDAVFAEFLRAYMDFDATPCLAHLEGMDLDKYKDTLIARFNNKHIRDQVSRICARSSTKIPRFLLPVVRGQLAKYDHVPERTMFVVAAWCRLNEVDVDEKGRQLVVIDAIVDELKAAAHKEVKQAGTFLSLEKFGDLGKNERVRQVFEKYLKEIRAKGIRECVKDMNANFKN